MSGLYRKKPITVEAWKIDASDWEMVAQIATWCGADLVDIDNFLAYGDTAVMAIITLEGIMYAEDGDWVIKGALGEFYPCKPDAFEASFEPLNQL